MYTKRDQLKTSFLGNLWVVLKRTLGFLFWVDVHWVKADLCLSSGGLGLGLLGQKHSLDVGEDTSLGNGHSGEKFVQLLVVADGQLQVTGDDSRLLVVTGGVSCQLQDLSGQVLEHGSEVHGGTSSNTLGVVALAQQSVDTSNRELQSSTG